jgi:DNA topoisomerase-1
MRDRHVDISGATLHFHFRGKSGKQHSIEVDDPRLARIVKRCQDLPGQELFQYLDSDGQQQSVGSADVNEYLQEITGQDFTAKDFRTWAGTVLAARALQELQEVDSQARAKKNIVRAVEAVSEMLGNTPTICRKCYVHPAVFEAYLDGALVSTLRRRADQKISSALHHLRPEEAAVLAFLQRRLVAEEQRGRAGPRNLGGKKVSRRPRGRGKYKGALPPSWRS